MSLKMYDGMSFLGFHERLSFQIPDYCVIRIEYLGDEQFRASKKTGAAKCLLLNGSIPSATSSIPATSGTTLANLNKSPMSSRGRIPPHFLWLFRQLDHKNFEEW